MVPRMVLTAMQEAEDGITGLAALERAATQSQTTVASTRRVLEMSASRDEGGDWCGVAPRGAAGDDTARTDCPAPLRQGVGTRRGPSRSARG